MFVNRSILTAAAITGIASASVQAQPNQLNVNVDMIMDRTVCGASYRLGDRRSLDFRINSQNGNVDIAVQNLPAEVVNAGRDRENVPITLIINGDFRTTADVGVFQAGFTYRAVAYWTNNDDGIDVLERLSNIQTLEVEIDGVSYGTATSQPSPDIGYLYITNCLEQNSGGGK